MNEIILATGNRHKVVEIMDVLRDIKVKVLTLGEMEDAPDVVEDGKTLEDNAIKKARTIARHYKKWALADDTGLEVRSLKGEPGVYSARWAGEGCTYADNNEKLLKSMEGVPESRRQARFRCIIAISDPEGKVVTVEGKIAGRIAEKIKGTKGFGYDPLFFIPRFGKTFAELSVAVKNKISHRGIALRKAKKVISKLL